MPTRYWAINAEKHFIYFLDCESIHEAERAAGLSPGVVGHGAVDWRIACVVDDFGMFVPPEQQSYVMINGRLFAGNMLLYGVNEAGETIDLDNVDSLRPVFLHGREEVEAVIQQGLVKRPALSINDETIWQWPEPRPEGL